MYQESRMDSVTLVIVKIKNVFKCSTFGRHQQKLMGVGHVPCCNFLEDDSETEDIRSLPFFYVLWIQSVPKKFRRHPKVS